MPEPTITPPQLEEQVGQGFASNPVVLGGDRLGAAQEVVAAAGPDRFETVHPRLVQARGLVAAELHDDLARPELDIRGEQGFAGCDPRFVGQDRRHLGGQARDEFQGEVPGNRSVAFQPDDQVIIRSHRDLQGLAIRTAAEHLRATLAASHQEGQQAGIGRAMNLHVSGGSDPETKEVRVVAGAADGAPELALAGELAEILNLHQVIVGLCIIGTTAPAHAETVRLAAGIECDDARDRSLVGSPGQAAHLQCPTPKAPYAREN